MIVTADFIQKCHTELLNWISKLLNYVYNVGKCSYKESSPTEGEPAALGPSSLFFSPLVCCNGRRIFPLREMVHALLGDKAR